MKATFLKSFAAILVAILALNVNAQTTIRYQGFEQNASDTWTTTFSTPPCASGGDVWDYSTGLSGVSVQTGSQMWGITDLNGNCGGSGFETITFGTISVSSYSSVAIKFDYRVSGWDNGDDIKYEVLEDGIPQGEVLLVDGSSNLTVGWTTETISITPGTNTVSLIVSVKQNGGDYGGLDNFILEGVAAGAPSLGFSTGSGLGTLDYTQGSGPSTAGSVTLTLANGDGSAVNVAAPADFEVSLSAGSGYTTGSLSNIFSNATSGSATIYVRSVAGLTTGSYSGNIAASGGGAASTTEAVSAEISPVPCTSLLAQSWENSLGWGYTSNNGDPVTGYDLSGNYSDDVWTFMTAAQLGGSLVPTDGNRFWGFEDIDNPSYVGEHTITFDPYDVSGASNMTIRFDWGAEGFDGPDVMGYQLVIDGTPQAAVNLCTGCSTTGSVVENIPNGTSSLSLILTATQNGNSDYGYFDNVNLCGTGTVSAIANPSLTVNPSSLNGFNTIVGTGSAPQTFELSGSDLVPASGNITVAAPAGYQVSTTNSSYTGTITVPYTGGTLAATTIYVRISNAASVGAVSGDITVSGGGATNQLVSVDGNVCPVPSGSFSPGDISIVGFSTDTPDEFAFATWTSIPNGTQLSFTENAFDGAVLNSNEGTVVWENNTGSAIAPGTVIVYTDGAGFDLGTVASGSINGLSTSGDNLFIYEGSATCPEFIYGITNSSWITSGSPSNSNSYLPSELNVANANLDLGSDDNYQFTGSRNDQNQISNYVPLVNNVSNWTGDNANITLSSTDFIIASANPSVELSLSATSGSEAATSSVTVTATASAPVVGDQTVTLDVSGTGITASDYNITNGAVITILNGNTDGNVVFTVVDDADVEGPETVTFSFDASGLSSGLIQGLTTTLDYDIADNDGTVLYSQSSGATNDAIWDIIPNGTGQTAGTFGGFSEFMDVVIQFGHTVELSISGHDMKSLTVEAGGKIYANNTTAPEYIDIFGNVVNNGTIGNGNTVDMISFNFMGTGSIEFSGTGSYELGRMRKNDGATGTVTLNADMNLNYPGACIYNNTSTSTYDLIIPAGRTINITDATGDVSIDGTDGTVGTNRGGSITVNGTLNIGDRLYARSNNSALPCSIVIGSAGKIISEDVVMNIDGVGFSAFTINTGGKLEVNGEISVAGGTLNSNGGLVLNDGASLLHGVGTTGGGGAVTGNVVVKRQGSAGNAYNYWSTPVSNTPPLMGSSAFRYDSNLGTMDYSDDAEDPGWIQYYSGPMAIGEGYASKGAGLVSFVGPVNDGNLSKAVVNYPFTPGNTDPGTPFNYVGNPYPGALNAAAFIAANPNIAGTIYYWNDDLSGGSGYSNTDYASWNGTGATGTGAGSTAPNGYVASCQGFVVRTTAGGSINFTNAMRASGNNDLFFRQSNERSRLWLSVEGQNLYNEILIGMLPEATDNEDRLYDAVKLRGTQSIALSAVNENKEYSILAFQHPFDERIIPLNLMVSEAGEFKFSPRTMENMEGYNVYFQDVEENTLTLLDEGTEVSVMLESGEYTNRFYLHYIPVLSTGIEEESSTSALSVYGNFGQTFVSLNGTDAVGNLEVFTTNGQLVNQAVNINLSGSPYSLDTESYSTGVYVVTFTSESQRYVARFSKM